MKGSLQMRQVLAVVLLLSLTTLMSCAGKVSPDLYERSYTLLKDSAERSSLNENHLKAYVITEFLLGEDPTREDVFAIKAAALRANSDLQRFEDRDILGSNLKLREKTDAGAGVRIITWPVNVLLDLIDVVTVEVGACLGAGVKAQVTDAVAVGGQLSAGQTVFGFRNRNFGTRVTIEEYLDLVFFEFRTLAEGVFNTGGARAISYSGAGVKAPTDPPNQHTRDYWAVGAQAEVGIIALNVQVHPLQVWDFLATVFFLDPLHDNIASTRGVKFDPDEIEAVKYIMRGQQGD